MNRSGRRRIPRPLRAARNLTYRVAVLATQMDRLEADLRGLREQVEIQQQHLDDKLRELVKALSELGVSIASESLAGASSAGLAVASGSGPARVCVFCNRSVDAWLPFRGGEANRPIFLKRVGSVGSNIARVWCPHCSSTDRERHLRLFIDRLNILDRVRGGAVLHIAPEAWLGDYIESHGVRTYVRGDISPSADGVKQIDVQQIPYPDETFDMVLCNHTLEHVDNVDAALREIHRVLRRGGRAICQTPYAARLTKTFEDPLLQSPDDRLFFYGQEDHVRLFGSDIEQHFVAAGFVGRLVPHAEILPDVDPEQFGINEREPFFDFVRP